MNGGAAEAGTLASGRWCCEVAIGQVTLGGVPGCSRRMYHPLAPPQPTGAPQRVWFRKKRDLNIVTSPRLVLAYVSFILQSFAITADPSRPHCRS
jgi:hypothetical protein